MKLLHAHSVKTFISQDGRQKLYLLARDDGLYEYRSEELVQDEFEGGWWNTLIYSGLYQTLADAERDARGEVPWLDATAESS